MCFNVVQCCVMWYSLVCGVVQCYVVSYYEMWCGDNVLQSGVVRHGTAWCGVLQCDVV